MNDRNKKRGTDDRPEDREGTPANEDGKRLRQTHLVRQPRPKQSSDEAESDGDKAPAMGPPRDSSANAAADAGDDQEKYEPW